MAIDIVTRLRSDFPKKVDCKEAADEIERLRTLLTETGISVKQPAKPKNIVFVEGTRHYQLLTAFAENTTLTTDEAGIYLDIPEGEYGWWAKISDLKTAGYLLDTELKRKSRKGVDVGVWAITTKGLKALQDAGYNGK
jgi:hypothetical protein